MLGELNTQMKWQAHLQEPRQEVAHVLFFFTGGYVSIFVLFDESPSSD